MKYNQSAAVIALLVSSVEAYWQKPAVLQYQDYENFNGMPIGQLAQSPEDFIVKPRAPKDRKQVPNESTKDSEKTSILEPVTARKHTTFYNKQKPMMHLAQSPEDFIVKPRDAKPRKQWKEDNFNKTSERVSILEPVIARKHTTFYNK